MGITFSAVSPAGKTFWCHLLLRVALYFLHLSMLLLLCATCFHSVSSSLLKDLPLIISSIPGRLHTKPLYMFCILLASNFATFIILGGPKTSVRCSSCQCSKTQLSKCFPCFIGLCVFLHSPPLQGFMATNFVRRVKASHYLAPVDMSSSLPNQVTLRVHVQNQLWLTTGVLPVRIQNNYQNSLSWM